MAASVCAPASARARGGRAMEASAVSVGVPTRNPNFGSVGRHSARREAAHKRRRAEGRLRRNVLTGSRLAARRVSAS